MSGRALKLEYDASEPPFLQTLRLGHLKDDDLSRRQIRPRMRAKDGQLDAEDGPTYVVEDSNDTVTADEAKAMLEEVATPATLGWDKELSPISNPDLPTSSTTPKVNTNEAKPHFPVHIGGAPKKRRIGLLAQPEAQAKTIKKQQTVVNDQRKKKKVHLKSAKPKLSFDEC